MPRVEDYRPFADRLSGCPESLRKVYRALDVHARGLAGAPVETATGEGMIYKLGRRVLLRADPKPARRLGLKLPLSEQVVLRELDADVKVGRVGSRPVMSRDGYSWIDVRAHDAGMIDRLLGLLDMAYERLTLGAH